MTNVEKRIRKYLTKWQRNLRLTDWRIKLIVIPKNDTTCNNENELLGSSSVAPQIKCATIKIAEPWEPNGEAELEATVIHELLHIHLDYYPWREDKTRDVMMEQTVDTLSLCFLKLSDPTWVDPRHNV